MGDGRTVELLTPTGVLLGQEATDFNDAIRQVGAVLVAVGAVDPSYVDAMLEREQSISTFVGEGVAIPHGTLAGKDSVLRDALAVVQFPGGVDWHGDRVEVCIGIAAVGDGHVGILAQLAEVLMDEDRAAALRGAMSVDDVIVILTPDDE